MATDRNGLWSSTMHGNRVGEIVVSHAGVGPVVRPASGLSLRDRVVREAEQSSRAILSPTRAEGAGQREIEEEPDPWRTCFERDRDRILHSSSFRRLAGKTQVFIFPSDHQRTRLTHALEVAQVARAIAGALGLNEALAEAIALGHDCGHGPGGHASEDAFTTYVAGGFDHAPWGADVTLAGLNLCAETLDGIRNHSWSRPAPSTPEGTVVSLADRIAYVCHDFEDAVSAGILAADELPGVVGELCGHDRRSQISAFIADVVATSATWGVVGMSPEVAGALGDFRAFNRERIYCRPAALREGQAVIDVLGALVEAFMDQPQLIEDVAASGEHPEGEELARVAVAYVAGMTDRYAVDAAVALLGWPQDKLPRGLGGRPTRL